MQLSGCPNTLSGADEVDDHCAMSCHVMSCHVIISAQQLPRNLAGVTL
jgi:hypothetical protein